MSAKFARELMMDTLCYKIDSDARAVVEFEKIRFELMWRHFDLHARQRTTMFNFFVILVPFLFGGCFILFKDRELMGSLPAVVAAGASALLVVIFFLLDLRNKQLYRVSKEALSLMENQLLFTSYRPLKLSGVDYSGVVSSETKQYRRSLLKHGWLMGTVYWLTIAMFVGLAGYFFAIRQGWIRLPLPSAVLGQSSTVSGR
jgi:hypothetical protein